MKQPSSLLKAFLIKEGREHCVILLVLTGLWLLQNEWGTRFHYASVILAGVFGFRMVLNEGKGHSWSFLLTKPIAREWLMALKWLSGSLLLFLAVFAGGFLLKMVVFKVLLTVQVFEWIPMFFPVLSLDRVAPLFLESAFYYGAGCLIAFWVARRGAAMALLLCAVVVMAVWMARYAEAFLCLEDHRPVAVAIVCLLTLFACIGFTKQHQIKE